MTETSDDGFDAFLQGKIDPAAFDHKAHIRYAQCLLEGHDFLEAAYLYDRSLRQITNQLGIPEKRSVTKTLAFMSLIAEAETSPTPSALDIWYSRARLNSPASRDHFLMPDRFENGSV